MNVLGPRKQRAHNSPSLLCWGDKARYVCVEFVSLGGLYLSHTQQLQLSLKCISLSLLSLATISLSRITLFFPTNASSTSMIHYNNYTPCYIVILPGSRLEHEKQVSTGPRTLHRHHTHQRSCCYTSRERHVAACYVNTTNIL